MKLLACFSFAALLAAQQPGWFSDREYGNVEVEFEYKLAQWAEAAFVLRTPAEGRPVQQGVAIFLAHDFHQKPGLYTTGALAGTAPPLELLPPSYEQWHKLHVVLRGDRLLVRQDGKLLQDTRVPRQKMAPGLLHFARLQHRYEIRNFRAKPLGEEPLLVRDWRPWQLRDGGQWKSGADWATGADGHGILYGGPELENFLFSAVVKATNYANGGVFVRGQADKAQPRGWEIQIYSPLDAVFPTGSIYGLVRSSIASETQGRWFFLQVLVEGRNCTVWVDGVEVARTTEAPAEPRKGRIGLQIHMEGAQVEWRQLRALRL